MLKLSLTILIVVLIGTVCAQENPHGKKLKLDCADCHTTDGWKFVQTGKFDHGTTGFLLNGQHQFVDCNNCHSSLVFSEAKSNCISCHADMHNTSLGSDCARCHNENSWIVSNISELHQFSRFPLLGAHNTADCNDCHSSASQLEFEPLGVECIDCHREDYIATTNPNHTQIGFSTDCMECHKIDAFEWSASGINHDFFPLTQGHALNDCAACHSSDITQAPPTDCYACHQKDYQAASNPRHQNSGFSTNCIDCHTTAPQWSPADFKEHDNLYFPIYSGKHNGEWNNCIDCHQNPENYAVFSCIDCHAHNRNDMNDKHSEVGGYSYNSLACFACHPAGDEASAFNHDQTGFLLKGAHLNITCVDCHNNGFENVTGECNFCHAPNYTQASTPNHVNAGISTNCATCHTEEGWSPSSFNHTATSGFELTGGHMGRQCADCHQGTTSGASSDCISCHQVNYNEAKDHVALGFPTNCLQCHNTVDWAEYSFDHNTTIFPLTGAHAATECVACHSENYTGTPTSCNSCHSENYTQAQEPVHTTAGIAIECEDCHNSTSWIPSIFNHTASSGFELTGGHMGRQCADCHQGTTSGASSDCISCHQVNYNEAKDHVALGFPTNCLQCHNTIDWAEYSFDHNSTNFPLTGSHTATECTACHTDGYAGTANQCTDCHQAQYVSTVNPSHSALGISNACAICHSTGPGWNPALFPNHNDYYALNGAHATISDNCFLCHSGNYSNTPNTCYACHTDEYNGTNNPNHLTAQFSTDCLTCHTETVWTPSTFDHDSQYFPIYSGKHNGKWNSCSECHTTASNYSIFSCIGCHEHNQTEMDKDHSEVANYVYNSPACLACHPNGD